MANITKKLWAVAFAAVLAVAALAGCASTTSSSASSSAADSASAASSAAASASASTASSASSAAAASSASASAAASSTAGATATTAADGTVSFTMKIDATDAGEGVLYDGGGRVDVKDFTVYQALVDTGLELTVDSTGYVDGIGDVIASKTGNMAGWLYTVNGEMAAVGAADYLLSDGDVVVWTFYKDASVAF